MRLYGCLFALAACSPPTTLPVATVPSSTPVEEAPRRPAATPPTPAPVASLRAWPILVSDQRLLRLWSSRGNLYVSGWSLLGRFSSGIYTPLVKDGLGPLRDVTGVVGGFPDTLLITGHYYYSEAETWGEVYRVGEQGVLALEELMPKYRWYFGAVEWANASLGLMAGTTYDPVPARFVTLQGQVSSIPKPASQLLLEPPTVTQDGALWALGRNADEVLVAERWLARPTGIEHSVTSLDTEWSNSSEVAVAKDDNGLVVLTSSSREARVAMHRVSTSGVTHRTLSLDVVVRGAAVCVDGSTWFMSSDRGYSPSSSHLWRLEEGESPRDMTAELLPGDPISDGPGVTSVACDDDDQLWFAANGVVLRTGERPATAPVRLEAPAP